MEKVETPGISERETGGLDASDCEGAPARFFSAAPQWSQKLASISLAVPQAAQ